MENPYSDSNFLAKWLNNDLTTQEKITFEQSDDYPKYLKLITSIDTLQAPAYDKEKSLEIINSTIHKKHKTISILPKWSYGIAAALVALIGMFFFFDNTITYATNYGEQIAYNLPDGSEVTLNSRSSIEFNKDTWDTSREVTLTGEAFFKVKKGSKFNVLTESGEVLVIGTQFTVQTNKDFFEVTCHEGTVKATGNQQDPVILTQGKAYRVIDNTIENWDIKNAQPSWISGETSFTNTPLKQVIESLQNQFNITINKNNIDHSMRFTGSYSHSDINLALKTIFVPMEISFTFKNENNIVLVKK